MDSTDLLDFDGLTVNPSTAAAPTLGQGVLSANSAMGSSASQQIDSSVLEAKLLELTVLMQRRDHAVGQIRQALERDYAAEILTLHSKPRNASPSPSLMSGAVGVNALPAVRAAMGGASFSSNSGGIDIDSLIERDIMSPKRDIDAAISAQPGLCDEFPTLCKPCAHPVLTLCQPSANPLQTQQNYWKKSLAPTKISWLQ